MLSFSPSSPFAHQSSKPAEVRPAELGKTVFRDDQVGVPPARPQVRLELVLFLFSHLICQPRWTLRGRQAAHFAHLEQQAMRPEKRASIANDIKTGQEQATHASRARELSPTRLLVL
jgi:hypothetical protein